MTTNMKIKIKDKQYTFRFNADKLRFECNYGFKNNYGIRQSRRLTGRSVDELTNNLKTFIKQVSDNSISNKTITFENFFDFYIENIAPSSNKRRTINNKKAIFKCIPIDIRKTQLNSLTVTLLQTMYNNLYKKYTINTVAQIRELISVVLNQAVLHNIITENINKKCVVKNFRNGKKNYISPKEANVLLDYVKNSSSYKHLYAPLLFLIYTGCRIGECIGLQKTSLNEQENTVKIEAQITQGEFDKTLKTDKSVRVIKVPEFVMQALIHDSNISTNNFVFTRYSTKYDNANLKPISYDHFITAMHKIFKACNLEYRSFKQFRNSFAKTAILNGVPLKVIQNILGHSRLSTTADIYGELESEDTFL